MKLREVIRAISGFKYEIYEYDVFPTGIKRRMVTLHTEKTNIRCLQHNMHHEQLVGGSWFILEKAQFDAIIEDSKPKKIITRKQSGHTTVKPVQKKSTRDRLIFVDHFKERLLERFGITSNKFEDFIKDVIDSHKVVQNSEFYNSARWNEHRPSDLHICSLKHNIIIAGSLERGKFKMITTYNARDCKWFLNWFEDNMDRFEAMPSLDQFFKVGT